MSERRIPLSEPHLVGNARRYLEQCLDTNYVSSIGPFVERFEREFADYVGAKFAVACSSGTAALHVAFRVLGVGPGDEVFVPSLTFIASANSIAYLGARPTFVDSETETWNLDPALVIEELERRVRAGAPLPKAVEAVHVLGHPADLERLAEACDAHGIALVEDAAEAVGARYTDGAFAGRHVGTIGAVGCFSFNGNKIITTGGGGMLVTDDETLARRAKHLTQQARVPGTAYHHDDVGYNYRLTNLAAALGVAQLEQLPAFLDAKRRIAAAYDDALGGEARLTLPPRAPWAEPSMWMYTVLVAAGVDSSRDEINQRLRASGIEARPIWTPLHRLPMYRDAARVGAGRVAERLADTGMSLPCSVDLGERDQDAVVRALVAALKENEP